MNERQARQQRLAEARIEVGDDSWIEPPDGLVRLMTLNGLLKITPALARDLAAELIAMADHVEEDPMVGLARVLGEMKKK